MPVATATAVAVDMSTTSNNDNDNNDNDSNNNEKNTIESEKELLEFYDTKTFWWNSFKTFEPEQRKSVLRSGFIVSEIVILEASYSLYSDL